MQRFKDILLGAVLGAGLTIAVAWLLVPTPERPSPFDTDADGAIDVAEFRSFMGAMFERADRDNDGRLSTEELDQKGKHGRSLAQSIAVKLRIDRIDVNNDGALTRAEFHSDAVLVEIFRALDDSGDGKLARGEGDAFAFDLLYPD